jgi:hypothetical protein
MIKLVDCDSNRRDSNVSTAATMIGLERRPRAHKLRLIGFSPSRPFFGPQRIGTQRAQTILACSGCRNEKRIYSHRIKRSDSSFNSRKIAASFDGMKCAFSPLGLGKTQMIESPIL